jgi:hypothetical protein
MPYFPPGKSRNILKHQRIMFAIILDEYIQLYACNIFVGTYGQGYLLLGCPDP